VNVLDNEARSLALTLPFEAIEGQGVLVAQGQVRLAGTAFNNVTVNLNSSLPTQLTVPATITISAGQSSATFDLTVVNNTTPEASVDVSITASAATFTTSEPGVIAAYDNDVSTFTQSTIASPQVEGVPVAWALTALGLDGSLLRAVEGPLTLSVSSSVPSLRFTPTTAGPFIQGAWTAPMRLLAPATNVRFTLATPSATVQSNAFTVGMGPRLTTNPTSLSVYSVQGDTVQQNVIVTNSGTGALTWSAQGTTSSILDSSAVFHGVQATTALPDVGPVYAAPSFASTTTTEKRSDHRALPDVLASLDTSGASLAALIPFRHDFTEGVTGDSIFNGGAGAFEGGNYLGTNLMEDWQAFEYSDGTVVNSASLGTGGRYFTRKLAGLFIMAADVEAVHQFHTSGNLGADSVGSVQGFVARLTRGSKTYKVFSKSVYGTSVAGVTHLIIVPDVGTPNHEFAQDSDYDVHRATNLGAVKRLYYLLFSSGSGHIVDQAAALAVAERFLDIVATPAWLSVAPASGTLAAGASQTVTATKSAATQSLGVTSGGLTFVSNDAVAHATALPVTLTVSAAPAPSTPELNVEPNFTGGTQNTLTWSNVGAQVEYQLQRDTSGTFSSPTATSWTLLTSNTQNDLTDGVTYHYRVRARSVLSLAASDWSASVRSTQDASAPALSFDRATGGFTGLSSVPIGVGVSDTSGIASLVFTPSGGSGINATVGVPSTSWSASLSSLALGLNTFTVVATDNAIPSNATTQTWTITRLNEAATPPPGEISPVLAAAFNVAANAPNAAQQTTPSTTTTELAADGKSYLTISFRRRIQATGFTYVVETSSDMIHWNAAGADVIEDSVSPVGDGIMEQCTCRITPAIEDADHKFVRVRVDLD
jgi:hypothetical protein